MGYILHIVTVLITGKHIPELCALYPPSNRVSRRVMHLAGSVAAIDEKIGALQQLAQFRESQ
jgi:hypothetical protein